MVVYGSVQYNLTVLMFFPPWMVYTTVCIVLLILIKMVTDDGVLGRKKEILIRIQ
mgnify:CR=1 FL=1